MFVLARATGEPVIVAATAAVDPDDVEMRERIHRHRRDRPTDWTVVGSQGPSLATLRRDASAGTYVLVEALGTWIAGYAVDLRAIGKRVDEI